MLILHLFEWTHHFLSGWALLMRSENLSGAWIFFFWKLSPKKRLEEPFRMEATVELETLCIRVITWGESYCQLVSALNLVCDCSWNSSHVVFFLLERKRVKIIIKKKKKLPCSDVRFTLQQCHLSSWLWPVALLYLSVCITLLLTRGEGGYVGLSPSW